jgi:simple sugar transport system substrate-binding protein
VKFLWAVLVAVFLSACNPVETPVRYLIGVSQANLSEPWRVSMTDEIQSQIALHPELRVIVADASDSLGKQIGDVEKFEGLGIDLLIISPLESEALTPTVARVYHSVPVIVVNRSVANDDYTVFIGPDNERIGQEAGRFVARTLKDKGGDVLEVLGRSASPPTLERAQGFRQEIARNPLIRLQSAVLANWLRDDAEDLVLDRLKADAPPRVIFAHNDAMAYGAWLAADQLGLTKKITFLGVDGLPGPRRGLELLQSGILDGTFVSPTGGSEAVEFALALLRHQGEQPKKVILGTRFLTRDTVVAPPQTSPPSAVAFVEGSDSDSWSRRLRDSVSSALGSWLRPFPPSGTVTGLDALVVDSTDRSPDDRRRREAAEDRARDAGLPLLRVGPQPPSGDASGWVLALGPDPAEEGIRAGRWLADRHVKTVLDLTGPADAAGTAERSSGLTVGLAASLSGPVEVLRFETDGNRETARRVVRQALVAGKVFDGVFAHTDDLALGAAAELAGRSIPIAGVGGGEEALDALSSGALSCIVRSPSDLGPLLRSQLVRYLSEGGVSRRLITSHDVVAR